MNTEGEIHKGTGILDILMRTLEQRLVAYSRMVRDIDFFLDNRGEGPRDMRLQSIHLEGWNSSKHPDARMLCSVYIDELPPSVSLGMVYWLRGMIVSQIGATAYEIETLAKTMPILQPEEKEAIIARTHRRSQVSPPVVERPDSNGGA